jgi:hypothetical protein
VDAAVAAETYCKAFRKIIEALTVSSFKVMHLCRGLAAQLANDMFAQEF